MRLAVFCVTRRRSRALVFVPLAVAVAPSTVHAAAPVWSGYARDPQHTGVSAVTSQSLSMIHWQTPIDLAPQYNGGALLTHYGSPLITAANTTLVPVKTTSAGGFRVDGRSGVDGSLLWTQTSDYVLPPHGWINPFTPTLTPAGNRLYMPAAGGTLTFRDAPDLAGLAATGRSAFFGDSTYAANPAGFNSSVFINTPVTSDASGNLYFGYQTNGSSPLASLGTGGVARISSSGVGTFTPASNAAPGTGMTRPLQNAAPALSNDGSTVYMALSNGSAGRLVALNATTLAPVASVALTDARTGGAAYLSDNGTSSPTVAPDGRVFMGVLENPLGTNNYRGWLSQFTASLAPAGQAGAFGWDITPSIVPADTVPSYTGTSAYLVMTKYNNYKNVGTGDGNNKLAILDPNASQLDPVSGISTMKEVLTISGVTPDPTLPAVREWCINTAAVDPTTKSILVNSEDGKLYRWDLTTNTFTQDIRLTDGLFEAYTPTAIGADGTVYAINDATLFAVGGSPPGQWNRDDSVSTWTSAASWSGAAAPNGLGSTATFGAVITADRVVNVDTPRVVGTINFNNAAHSYTLSGANITINTAIASGGINVMAGSHTIASNVVLAKPVAISIASGAALKLSGDVSGGKVSSLNIASGGKLDVTDNNLIVAGGAVGSASGGTYTGLSGLIQSGRNGGGWNGNGLTTSFPAAATGLTSLGIATAAQVGRAGGTFGGVSVVGADVLVMYTYTGDANLDGFISGDDYSAIDFAIAVPGASGWVNGDFNYDGIISGDDYSAIDFNIVAQGTPFPTAGSSTPHMAVTVPEPLGTASFVGVAAALIRRRRRG